MGKKLGPVLNVRSPRGMFAKRLRELAGDMTPAELAAKIGCSDDTARKYLTGKRVPDLNSWPKIAKALGLRYWQDLLPSRRQR